MSNTKALLFDLLFLALLLVILFLPAFPQIESKARITLTFMILGLILIIRKKGEED